jgi:hypothetical protein
MDFTREGLTGWGELPEDAARTLLSRIMKDYNRLVGGQEDLNKVTDPYRLTLYKVMCELSIQGDYDLAKSCQPLDVNDRERMDHALNELVKLINKAHGHANEEGFGLPGQHSSLHVQSLRESAQISPRNSERSILSQYENSSERKALLKQYPHPEGYESESEKTHTSQHYMIPISHFHLPSTLRGSANTSTLGTSG